MDADNFFAALADGLRRRILALLHEEDELCVCEMVQVLGVPQPKVSKHLALLREARIVRVRRVGTWIFYRFSVEMPLWAYKTIELMVEGESGNALFGKDADSLACRPVRYAEVNVSGRRAICRPCDGSDVSEEVAAA